LRINVPRKSGSLSGPQSAGPKPFSREWVQAPPEVRAAPTRPAKATRARSAPGWLPSPRMVSITLVGLLVLVSAIASTSLTPGLKPESTEFVIINPQVFETSVPGTIGTPEAQGNVITATATIATNAAANFPTTALLPSRRIVAFYGHPHDPNLGILGQYSKEDLLAQLREEAGGYERADATTTVMPAFEVIASVAQSEAGADGTWLAQTDEATIRDYIAFTQANGILLILDIQMGRTTVEDEWAIVAKYMNEPNVHLAIDPEFAMKDDQVPGVDIGSVDADDINFVQTEMAKIVADNNLPPKLLIVHRFTDGMITNTDKLEEVDGVQLVIDTDGFGDPASKTATFELYARDGNVKFAGIKLFYDQDHPLMQPADVLDLDPTPNFILYQ